MSTNFYYVYAIKDPRSSPAKAFYAGKGTGSRAYDHLVTPDQSRKYVRIKDIIEAGLQPFVDILVEDLTEAQALRLEAELISAYGTEETGGFLTNAVVPVGLGGKKRSRIVVPQGAVERAQLGLEFLKSAVLDLARANPAGISNSDAASLLGLRSDYRGRQKDYLSYSVLGLLLREGRIKRQDGVAPRHVAATEDHLARLEVRTSGTAPRRTWCGDAHRDTPFTLRKHNAAIFGWMRPISSGHARRYNGKRSVLASRVDGGDTWRDTALG